MNIAKKLPLIALCLSLLAPSAATAAAAGPETTERTELLSAASSPLTPEEAQAFFPSMLDDEGRFFVVPAVLIVMAGAKAWNVIMDNRPTADLDSAYASAIPGFDFNWDNLKDWRKVTKKYRYTIDNKLQGRAVDITYEVSYYYGSLPTPGAEGLKGHYLANFTVKPLDINLKWGWKIGLEVSMSDPMNVGTAAEPVAWLNADLKWRYAKPLSTEPKIGLNSLSVDGLGTLSEISYKKPLSLPPVPAREGPAEPPAMNWD